MIGLCAEWDRGAFVVVRLVFGFLGGFCFKPFTLTLDFPK